jgi:chemotaxis protein MotB
MGHGGGEEGGENSERWLVSYADFITLLMVLFVVLYSMGQIDVEKYKALAASMRSAFTLGGGPVQVIELEINEASGSMEEGSPKPIVVPGIPESPPQSEEIAGQLTEMLATANLGSEVSVQTNIEGILISLSEKLVFAPGTATLPDEALPVLNTIAEMIKPVDNQIRLVGHTDDTPPVDPQYHNNMELSLARALAVADYLSGTGVRPERFIISGRGQYQPVFHNDSPEHRALNGRVEIIVVYNVDSSVIGMDSMEVSP